MASRLPKSSLVALSLGAAVMTMAMAPGGSACAQVVNEIRGGKVNVRCEGPTDNCLNPAGGSLRDAPESDTTNQPATVQAGTSPAPEPAAPVEADEPLGVEGLETVAPPTDGDTNLADKGEVPSQATQP